MNTICNTQTKYLNLLAILMLFSQLVAADTLELDIREGNNPIVFMPPLENKPQIIQGEMKPDVKLPRGVKFQNELEAWNADNAALAKALGITKEEVDRSIVFQDAFTQYANRIRARYPDKVSGVWVDAVPATIGNIRFIGEVPSELLIEVEKRGQGDQIVLIGGGTVKESDHARDVKLVAQTLRQELKLNNFKASYNVFDDVIDVEIIRPKNTVPLDKLRIIEAIRNKAKGSGLKSAIANFRPDNVRLNETIGTEPIINLEVHFGGAQGNVLVNDSPVCTTGWSVTGPIFGDGLITAGHCAAAFGGLESYTTNQSFYEINRVHYITSWWGDAAYYAINNYTFATDDFYASFNTMRDTAGVMPISQMLGQLACRFGMKSGTSCGHRIISTFACSNFLNNYITCNLIEATQAASLPGDSGGPWYRGNTALGVHIGTSATTSFFMSADQIERYWGLTVKH